MGRIKIVILLSNRKQTADVYNKEDMDLNQNIVRVS